MEKAGQFENREMVLIAEQRHYIYGFLARVYHKEVTPDVLKLLKGPQFLGALSDIGVQLGSNFLEKSDNELMEDLAVEYTRLFIGPDKHISPYESVHHDRDHGDWGSLWGASTVEVKKFMGIRLTLVPPRCSILGWNIIPRLCLSLNNISPLKKRLALLRLEILGTIDVKLTPLYIVCTRVKRIPIKKFIESAGLEYKSEYHNLPDHIGVELEFMHHVTLRESQAWKEGDRDGALYCLKMEKLFINDHLIKWTPVFCDKVISQAELTFYKEMAKLTRSFIEFENEKIDEYVAKAKYVQVS